MANTVVTFRPNGTADAGGVTNVGGAGTQDAALADNSDTTYLQGTSNPNMGRYDFTTFGFGALPVLAQIRSVTPRARMNGNNLSFFLTNGATNKTTNAAATGLQTNTGAAETTNFSGGAWTQNDIDAIQMKGLNPIGLTTGRWYEAYIDVAYNEAPVVSAITPSGTITTTAQPTIGWTYTDPEGDAQERFRVKIYSGTTVIDFPDTTAAFADSGEVFSGAPLWVPTQALPAGSYRVYIKTADVGSNGRYGGWTTSTFTIQIDPPATPIVTATPDATLARIGVTVQGIDNMLSANQASLETDTSGWYVNSGCTIARSTAQFLNGVASLAMTSTSTSPMSARTGDTTSAATIIATATPVVANKQYTALASFRAAATARSATVGINWYTAAGAFISTSTGTGAADSTTGWTQPSVTASAPGTAAFAIVVVTVPSTVAAEVHYVDQIDIGPGSSLVWTAGGRIPSSTVIIEKTINGGATWSTVRGGAAAVWDSAANQTIQLYDYEVPRNIGAGYRARVAATVPYAATSGNGLSLTAAFSASGWWLKDPFQPGSNMQLDVQPGFSFRRKEPQSVFEPVGRNVAVIVSDGVRGIEGSLTVWAKDSTRYAKLADIVDNGHTLWLEDPFGRAWYVHLGDATEWALLRATPLGTESTPIRHIHSVTIPFTEVGSPAGDAITAGTPTP